MNTILSIKKNKFAFTLIELLVVIAVVGILSTLAVVVLQGARGQARDAKRVADAKQMQIALELYYHDNNVYPSSLIPEEPLSTNSVTYMETIPSTPTPNDGTCSENENYYTYITSYDQSYYNIHFCIGKDVGNLLSGEVIASPQGLNNWTCGEYLLDYRDGQFYRTVSVGNQCWMAENLNYDDDCSLASFSGDPDQANACRCYNNNSSSCDTFGKLYQWRAAMKGSESEKAQGICPNGWHIPDEDEIYEMIDYATANYSDHGYMTKSLASQYSWEIIEDCYGYDSCYYGAPGFMPERNNISGLSFMPSGFCDPGETYQELYSYITLWSSSLSYPNAFTFWLHDSGSTEIGYNNGYLSFAFPVRCIR
jgi:uncharacterized protein (TIGR02145 family)/prepilin-type N-terminal cleavage/methylation domain-containing protein